MFQENHETVNCSFESTVRNAETQTTKKEGFWYQFLRCIVGKFLFVKFVDTLDITLEGQ